MIKPCPGCGKKPHSQDIIHGPGLRVFNENKGKSAIVLRCTVCGDTQQTPLTSDDKKSK